MTENYIYLTIFSLSLILLFAFINFCFKAKIFHRFGRKDLCLSWFEFSILTICGLIPMAGFFIEFYLVENIFKNDLISVIISSSIIGHISFKLYNLNLIFFKE